MAKPPVRDTLFFRIFSKSFLELPPRVTLPFIRSSRWFFDSLFTTCCSRGPCFCKRAMPPLPFPPLPIAFVLLVPARVLVAFSNQALEVVLFSPPPPLVLDPLSSFFSSNSDPPFNSPVFIRHCRIVAGPPVRSCTRHPAPRRSHGRVSYPQPQRSLAFGLTAFLSLFLSTQFSSLSIPRSKGLSFLL